jgi:gliding motility-associated-like protein
MTTSSTTPVPYAGGYSGTTPMPGITIDPITGLISFTPTMVGNFVVCFLVEEWNSSGVLIGSVIRDIQMVVVNCTNQVIPCNAGPITNLVGFGATVTGSNSMTICENIPFSFDVSFTDPDAANILSYTSNIATVLPGAIISSTGSNPITISVSWTAPIGSANTNTSFALTVSDNACPVTGQQTVNYIIEVLPAAYAGTDQIICGTQSAQLNAMGPGNTFTWSVLSGPAIVVGTNFSCNPCQFPQASPASTTTYLLSCNGGSGCILTDTVTIFVVPDFSFTTSQSAATSCLTNPVQLNTVVNPAGAHSYSWSPLTNLNNPLISNPIATFTVPGSYSYVNTITSDQGCVKRDTVDIVIIPVYPPEPALSYTSAPCLGDSIQINASFGTPIVTVCALDSVGCAASLSASIGTPTGSNTTTTWPAIFGNWYTSEKHQMLFTAAELNAAGITGGKIDQLDVEILTLSGITTYHQFTIKMGCTNLTNLGTSWETGLLEVFAPSTVNIALGMNTFAFSDAFAWDGVSNIIVEICSSEGPGAFGYSNYTTSSVSPYTTTSFTSCLYSFTDQFDMCPDMTNFITQSFNRPVITFHHCSGAPDISTFSYVWSPNPLVASPTSQNTAASVPGNTTYTLVVTDNLSGCVDSSSLSVVAIVPTTFNMTVGNDVTICPGAPTTLSASGATTYLWSPSTGLSSPTSANPVASPMSTITYTVTGSTPCAPSITDSVTVTAVNSVILNVDAGNDITICPGASTTLNATGATNYVWSPGTSLSSTTVANPIASPVNTITYTVTGTAFCANPVVDSVTITTDNTVILNVSAGNNVTICPGTPTTLNATGATTYSWAPPTALSSTSIANPVASPSTTTTYTVTGTAFCADPVSSTVTVTAVNSVILNVDAGNDTAICPGMPTVLAASGATNYVWSPSTGLSTTVGSTTISSPSSTITYTVTGSGPCANPVQDSITVNVLTAAQLNVSAGSDGAVCVGDPINLSAATSGGYSGNFYEWSVLVGSLTDSISNSHSLNAYVSTTVEGVNIYEITVTDLCGNIASDTVIYDVSSGCELTVPNIFTPNGDGNNDVFVVTGKGVSSFSISIFNRWGKKVYESTDISEAWTGGGNEDGTYFYVVQGRSRNGNDLTSKGYLQLLSK